MKRAIIVGAGPVGLVAALGAERRGWEVTVLEAGEVGDALRRWGATRLFTPFAMNLPRAARALLSRPPDDGALLTGPELAERVLEPLARSAPLDGRVRTRHRVRSISRARLLRGELAGHPLRSERPFRVLVETPSGDAVLEAERVLDASGVYGQPVELGARGEPAVAARLVRDLGALEWRRVRLGGKRVLVAGAGHSAAHAVALLDEVAREHPETRVTWAVRSAQARPCVEVAGDPLPERRAVVERANRLAERPPAYLTVERRAAIEELELDGDEALRVTLTGGRRLVADEIVALLGYRPDLAIVSELPLEISPATEGAARLSRALAGVTDCLSTPAVAAADLDSGEPGFHLVGAKSYGRSRAFLLETAYAQLETILDRF